MCISARDTENEDLAVSLIVGLFSSLSSPNALDHNCLLEHDQSHAVPPLVIAYLLKQVQKRISPDIEVGLHIRIQNMNRHEVLIHAMKLLSQDILVTALMTEDDSSKMISGIAVGARKVSIVKDMEQGLQLIVLLQRPVMEVLL